MVGRGIEGMEREDAGTGHQGSHIRTAGAIQLRTVVVKNIR